MRTLGARIKERAGVVRRVDGVSGVTSLGYGLFLTTANGQQDYDLGIGALSYAFAPQSDFSRLAELDLNSGSQTNRFANYAALPIFLYGRGGSTNESPRLASTDLDTWPTHAAGIVDPTPTPLDNDDGTETLTYRRADPAGPADHAFMRVEVDQTSP